MRCTACGSALEPGVGTCRSCAAVSISAGEPTDSPDSPPSGAVSDLSARLRGILPAPTGVRFWLPVILIGLALYIPYWWPRSILALTLAVTALQVWAARHQPRLRRLSGLRFPVLFMLALSVVALFAGDRGDTPVYTAGLIGDIGKLQRDRYRHMVAYATTEGATHAELRGDELSADKLYRNLSHQFVPLHLIPAAACVRAMGTSLDQLDAALAAYLHDRTPKQRDNFDAAVDAVQPFISSDPYIPNGRCDETLFASLRLAPSKWLGLRSY